MDTPRAKQEQKAKFLAFLLFSEIEDHRCAPEDLSSACLAFSVSAEEIRKLCELPNVPLRLLDDGRHVEVTKSFDIRFTSLLSLLHNQAANFRTCAAYHVVDLPSSRKGDCVPAKPISTCEPVASYDSEGVNAIQLEPAVMETRTQVESCNGLLPTGNIITTDCSIGYNHIEKPSYPSQRTASHLSVAHAENPGNLTQIEDFRNGTYDGNICEPLEHAQKEHLGTTEVENPCNTLQRTEKTPLATAAACLAEQGLVPLLTEMNAQPKKKPRDSRSVPSFENYAVDGEVGAGGYGTVYKVRRHSDDKIFAMKCPLENTHDSSVRNEISMLKRLRGKDYIIQFQDEVVGKVISKPDAGRGEDVNCPSILLDFIEHDKPEILKKEITIDELKLYSFSLFKALAQLHKERILHLDVKPGNFLFARSMKRGCLVDFNLARDESAARLSSRRPERRTSRPSPAEAKNFERRKVPKRPFAHEDTTQTSIKPSKRCRQIFEILDLGTPPASMPCVGDESKGTTRPAASKDAPVASPKYQQLPPSRSFPATGAITASIKPAEPLKVIENRDNTGNAQQPTTCKSQQALLCDLARENHRFARFWAETHLTKTSYPSTPPFTQPSKGVRALKVNPNKRVPAAAPPFRASAQPSSAKRMKPALKTKAPGYQVRDGPCVGTKGYRAPEVLLRSTRQTTKVDIWSAGVSLLQLVTGRSPFPSTSTEGALKDIAKLRGSAAINDLAKSLHQRHRFLKDHHYPRLSVKEWSDKYSRRTDLKGIIPSALYDLIERCLDVNPDSRITADAALAHQFCSIDEPAVVLKTPNSMTPGTDLPLIFPDANLLM